MILCAEDGASEIAALALADRALARAAVALLALRGSTAVVREERVKIGQRLAEFREEQIGRLAEGIAQGLRIFRPSHPEVREVMEVCAEHLVAVGEVLVRVEDVVVPEGVDGLRRHNRIGGVLEVEGQEPLVPNLDGIHLLESPTFTLFGLHQLDLDGAEIEALDVCESCSREMRYGSRCGFHSRKVHGNAPNVSV